MKKIVVSVFCLALAALVSACATSNPIPPKAERLSPPADKRGVAYAFEQDKTPEQDMALLSPAVKWFYNWFVIPEAKAGAAARAHKVAYYPMVWNYWDYEKLLEPYLAANPDTEYLMGFNEPNLKDQCNYTPKEAARYWPHVVQFAKKHHLKLVSPALNYGTMENYWVPWVWLDEFFGIDRIDDDTGKLIKNKGYRGVSLADIDAIAIHCYMPDAGAMKWFISNFKKYNKPIWMSEFCSWEFSQPNAAWQNMDYQMMFMSEAITYLELDPDVEKYAWFIPKGAEDENAIPGNKLLTKGPNPQLTPLGIVFVNMGTCDKSVWVPTGQRIMAAHFTDMLFSDYINSEAAGKTVNWPRKEQGFTKGSGVHFRPGTDPDGEALDMFDFTAQKWVEYQIEVPDTGTWKLSLRNTADEAAKIDISVDGQSPATAVLPQGNAWKTSVVPLQMEAGRHTLRLTVTEGDCALNWLELE
ncbi:MAG: glycosyl hydrolase [Treponema sp.]|nr:glycosyl hydrolase [Treponema sp.]